MLKWNVRLLYLEKASLLTRETNLPYKHVFMNNKGELSLFLIIPVKLR